MELYPKNPTVWAEKVKAYNSKKHGKRAYESTQGVILFEARLCKELAPKDVTAREVDQVEAQLRMKLQVEITEAIREHFVTVSVGQDLLTCSAFPKNGLHTLKVLEHLSESPGPCSIPISENNIEVSVYHMCNQEDNVGIDDGILQFASATAMPNENMSNIFQGLIFGDGLRSSIISMIIKTLENARIRERSGRQNSTIEPLGRILFYGPPGTGKSSLAISVAHIVAIHHQAIGPTVLIQVEAGHLINHMFGESSARLIRLFEGINKLCEDEPGRFICIIIDEVEALGGSRKSDKNNECGMENTRVTSALLRGLDNLKQRANCFTICTTNLVEKLDPAFVDRLGLQWKIDAPGLQPIYEILQSSLQSMMLDGIIPKEEIPEYMFSKKMVFDGEVTTGASLYSIAYQLFEFQHTKSLSARIVRQLPEQAWVCSFAMTLCSFSHMLDILDAYVQKMYPSSIPMKRIEQEMDDEDISVWDSNNLLTNDNPIETERFEATKPSNTASDLTVTGYSADDEYANLSQDRFIYVASPQLQNGVPSFMAHTNPHVGPDERNEVEASIDEIDAMLSFDSTMIFNRG